MKNIISIDWEDWFHICEVEHLLPREKWDSYPSILDEATDRILELLAANKTKATFFIVGYSAKRRPELIKRIAEEGHEIAHHTMAHDLIYDLTPAKFDKDIRQGKKLLERLSDRPVVGFRAPQWSMNQRSAWATDVLIDAGYEYDSSRAPLPIIGSMDFDENVYEIKGSKSKGGIIEIPPLVLKFPLIKVPAGGGWGVHTWPLKWIINKALKLNKKGSPATFFFHPVDFVKHDYGKDLPFIKKAVTTFGLRTTQKTCEYLFDNLELGSIKEILPTLHLRNNE